MNVRVLSRTGNPFEVPAGNQDMPAEHRAVLNSLFFDGSVDLGGRVEIDGCIYTCTTSGWIRVS